MKMKTRNLIAAALVAAAAGSVANAATYNWNWTRPSGSVGYLNDSGGTFKSVNASFDSVAQRLVWNVTFSDRVTNGYFLAINNGPNPKGHAGELGLLYLDTRTPSAPKTTVYAYNGQNASNSWLDGNGVTGGNQTADLIHSSLDTTFVENVQVQDVGATDRQINLTIRTNVINGHNPMYPGPMGASEWTGMAFDNLLGLWFHPMRNLNASYDSAGRLTNWGGTQGWFDGSNFTTTSVPLPTAAGAGMLAMGALALRRRRNG
jgi:MYXO-CTERM domain-containing protein